MRYSLLTLPFETSGEKAMWSVLHTYCISKRLDYRGLVRGPKHVVFLIYMFPCIIAQYTKMTNNMQLCRIIYYSLTALHVSSDIFAHHQDHLNCIRASGIIQVCRCRLVSWECWHWSEVLTQPVHKTVTCREWQYQRLHIHNYDLDLLKMSRVMLETCRGF
jgi:hypothetical protein